MKCHSGLEPESFEAVLSPEHIVFKRPRLGGRGDNRIEILESFGAVLLPEHIVIKRPRIKSGVTLFTPGPG
ncbi:MAG: hypothetical protein V9F01_09960 [Chitinophagaceae bacterium]